MAKLECDRCKSVFQDVVRVRRCPLCGGTKFADAGLARGRAIASLMLVFPWWFTREGNFSFHYEGTTRLDKFAEP